MLLDDCMPLFINLKHRDDRFRHMTRELARVGIEADRFPAIYTGVDNHQKLSYNPIKVQRMMQRTPGAIGCHYSQVSVMAVALQNKRHAFVMEDDLIICTDIKKRLNYIEKFLTGRPWDIIWLGGTFHVNPAAWHTGRHPEMWGSTVGRDAECTEDPRILRTFGAFSTYAYLVNYTSIPKILNLLEANIQGSMGIDWLFIKLQPQLLTYAFVPGCVKQFDNKSDIGNGITEFSKFDVLGPYWFQDKMEDFDPSMFNWAEAKIK